VRMRINESGYVGIGTDSPVRLLSVYGAPSGVGGDGTGVLQALTSNENYDGSPTSAISFWTKYDSSGNTFPMAVVQGGKENTTDGNYAGYLSLQTTTGAGSSTERLRIDSSGVVKLITANDTAGTEKFLTFGSNSFNRAGIKCTNAGTFDGSLEFYTGNSTNFQERARLDKDGNLLVGTTDELPVANNDSNGIALRADGNAQFSRASAATARFNRKTDDGEIVSFHKDGASVGSIGTAFGYMAVGTDDTGISFRNDLDSINPFTMTGNTNRDAAIDLGASSTRFKDLYLSGGVYVGGTGAANYLDDYEEGTFTPSLEFGGTSTGITYQAASQVGIYTKVGNLVHISIEIRLTSKGTSTGTMTISGLPFNSGGTSLDWQSLSCANFANFTNLNSAPAPSTGFGGAVITIRHLGASDGTATGDDLLDDTNATNSLILGITGTYITT
jgi:hypothetical protein